MNKQEILFTWIKSKGFVNSVQIRQWGLDNFYISADRVVRKFAEECKIQRISEEEITFRNLRKNGSARIAWYKI